MFLPCFFQVFPFKFFCSYSHGCNKFDSFYIPILPPPMPRPSSTHHIHFGLFLFLVKTSLLLWHTWSLIQPYIFPIISSKMRLLRTIAFYEKRSDSSNFAYIRSIIIILRIQGYKEVRGTQIQITLQLAINSAWHFLYTHSRHFGRVSSITYTEISIINKNVSYVWAD